MKYLISTLILITAIISVPALAQTWGGGLQDGSQVQINPQTNKATRLTEKGSSQLWDGTHRLNDGSVIIVRDGIVISGGAKTRIEPADEEAEIVPHKQVSACTSLVIKVCGFSGACNQHPACSPARQLMKLEQDEARQSNRSGPNQTTAQCKEALASEKFFSACQSTAENREPSSCESLVSHTCGSDNQCGSSPACTPARQLLEMESQERSAIQDPNRPTYSSKQCAEAITKNTFFSRCESLLNEAN